MFSKKYIIFYLILLFLLTRLYLLFAGLDNLTVPTEWADGLYSGTTAKMYMDGSINSLLEYRHNDYDARSIVESLAAIPFFYVFGPYLFSLKLVILAFLLATMVLWFLFMRRYVSAEAGVITVLLFIFAPPHFISYNLTVGYHSVISFFDILTLTFFFEMIRNTPSPLLVQSSSIEPNISVQATSLNQPKVRITVWHVLFGIAAGFALWVDNVSAIMLTTCIVFWFIQDKLFFTKRTFAIFVISFLTGFSIWFYYVVYIRHFQIDIEYVLSSPKVTFYKKFLETLVYNLPYSLCFKDYLFSGVFLNYLYYTVFVMAFAGLIWFERKPLLKMLSSFIPAKWQVRIPWLVQSSSIEPAECGQVLTVESFLLGYIVIFILTFSLSSFDVGFKSNYFWHYRHFTPLYPFIFVTIAIGLSKLLNSGRIPFKLISYVFILALISTGILGLASQTSIRDFGKGLTFKGYTYKALLALSPRSDFLGEVVKTGGQIDDGLYKNSLYQGYGFRLAYFDKLDLSACEPLIRDIEEMFRPNCYEGFGYGYAVRYWDNVSTLFEKLETTNFTNEAYEKYLLYGIAAALPIQETVDKHTFIIAQIDSQFQPYFYQELGIQLARRMGLVDADGILLQIDETNRKYCYIGIGQNFAGRLEWAFADKKYYIGFDGLNKDYWEDCYYGLGWGIGDFFEFDMDRYLAVINNNVSPEYLEYCFKGLADRLRWKFGSDDTKLQKLLNLIPAVEYFVLEDGTIRFFDKSHRKYLFKGWSSTEQWGTWSEGEESVILVNFKGLRNEIASPASGGLAMTGGRDYTMRVKATGFSVPGKQQSVKIYFNDNLLGEHTFTHPVTYFEDFEVKIPSRYIKEGNQRIKFIYNFIGSPVEYGIGPDLRQLAMGVSSIEFK